MRSGRWLAHACFCVHVQTFATALSSRQRRRLAGTIRARRRMVGTGTATRKRPLRGNSHALQQAHAHFVNFCSTTQRSRNTSAHPTFSFRMRGHIDFEMLSTQFRRSWNAVEVHSNVGRQQCHLQNFRRPARSCRRSRRSTSGLIAFVSTSTLRKDSHTSGGVQRSRRQSSLSGTPV